MKASFSKEKKNEGVTEYVEIEGRGHALTIDSGWRQVADTALARQLEHGRRLGDRRETIQGGGAFHTAVKTGSELAAEAEQSLVEIDAEIARVT